MFNKGGLIRSFFSSNNYLIGLIVIAPVLLYFVFGTALYHGLDEVADNDLEIHDLEDRYGGEFDAFDGEIMDEEVEQRVDPEDGTKRLAEMHTYTYGEFFFKGLFFLASISFMIGAAMASVSWGTMVEEGAIVYPILLKSSRERAFAEMFSFPLIFVTFISVVASMLIASEALTPFPDVGFSQLFFLTFITLITTMIGGYTLAVFISLSTRSSFLPIIASLFFVGGLNLYKKYYDILYPARGFIDNHYFGIAVGDEVYLGMLVIIIALVSSFVIFKRGDFY